jgi:hypothetical protein
MWMENRRGARNIKKKGYEIVKKKGMFRLLSFLLLLGLGLFTLRMYSRGLQTRVGLLETHTEFGLELGRQGVSRDRITGKVMKGVISSQQLGIRNAKALQRPVVWTSAVTSRVGKPDDVDVHVPEHLHRTLRGVHLWVLFNPQEEEGEEGKKGELQKDLIAEIRIYKCNKGQCFPVLHHPIEITRTTETEALVDVSALLKPGVTMERGSYLSVRRTYTQGVSGPIRSHIMIVSE